MWNKQDKREHEVNSSEPSEVQNRPEAAIDQREQAANREHARVMADLERLLQIRLAPDNMLLELYLMHGQERIPIGDRIEAVKKRAEELGVTSRIDDEVIRRAFASGKEKQWHAIAHGTPAVAPVNSSVELLVPSVPPLGKDRFRERPFVSAGDVLVVITNATDGVPGVNLKGMVLPAPTGAARRAAVPNGPHTVVQQEGGTLKVVAECDGLIYFDRMQFGIYPMQLVASSSLRYGAKIEPENSVAVRENVPSGATIVSRGDIYIAGDVDDSTLISETGSITVLGCVTGHLQDHCRLQAKGDVMVASALHVDITSEQDVYIQTQARSATITAARNLVLLTRLRNALYDVDLEVEGAVMPFDSPTAAPDVTPDQRTAFAVECQVVGRLGMLEGQVVPFRPCMISQLSLAVALVAFIDSPPLSANKVVYLKFQLPGSHPLQILGRTGPPAHDGRTVVGFRQMSHQDEMAITAYCLSLARSRVEAGDVSQDGERMI